MSISRQPGSSLRRLMILAGIAASMYAINRLVLIPIFPDINILKQYLADFLALPVYLPLSTYLAWRLKLVNDQFQLHPIHILGGILVFSILFEGLIPLIDTTSIRDPFDVLAYFAGGVVVFLVSIASKDDQVLED